MSLGRGIGVELNQDGFSWFNGSYFQSVPIVAGDANVAIEADVDRVPGDGTNMRVRQEVVPKRARTGTYLFFCIARQETQGR